MSRFKDKLGSGKFYVTVCLITTYCLILIGCVALAILKMMDIAVLLALLSGFGALVGMVVEGYFHKQTQGEQNEKLLS